MRANQLQAAMLSVTGLAEIDPSVTAIEDRERPAELAARNRLMPLTLKCLELAQVKADSTHHGLGGELISRRLALRVPHEVTGSSGKC